MFMLPRMEVMPKCGASQSSAQGRHEFIIKTQQL